MGVVRCLINTHSHLFVQSKSCPAVTWFVCQWALFSISHCARLVHMRYICVYRGICELPVTILIDFHTDTVAFGVSIAVFCGCKWVYFFCMFFLESWFVVKIRKWFDKVQTLRILKSIFAADSLNQRKAC